MNTIASALQAIQVKIDEAKKAANRHDSVHLLAVSKAQSPEKLVSAYVAGQRAFGENYLQEAIAKQALLRDYNIEWHFIGPIQSNKTNLIAQHFDWVQSVDRLKIAQRLSDARPKSLPPLNICLQMNSSSESSKSGVEAAELLVLAKEIVQLPNLKLRGLMAIPAPSHNETQQLAQFKQVRLAFDKLQQQGLALDTLSIGMSDDYIAAIHEGATLIRIGSAIFGARPTKDEEKNE
jgi:PLP dependent protein